MINTNITNNNTISIPIAATTKKLFPEECKRMILGSIQIEYGRFNNTDEITAGKYLCKIIAPAI